MMDGSKLGDMPGSDVGLVRSKVSLWIRPNKGEDQPWLGSVLIAAPQLNADQVKGILLVDPTIAHGFPLW
jgi:hypothetical protein